MINDHPNVLPLALAQAGKKYQVCEINAGKRLNARLIAIGILPNSEIQIINNASFGSDGIIVKVGSSRFSMGKGMALKIMVKEI